MSHIGAIALLTGTPCIAPSLVVVRHMHVEQATMRRGAQRSELWRVIGIPRFNPMC